VAIVRVAAPQPVTVRPGISTVVALALFALFFVYITARGRLPQYLAVLFGPVSVTQTSGTGGGFPGIGGQGVTVSGPGGGALVGSSSTSTDPLTGITTTLYSGGNLDISGGGDLGNLATGGLT
jgi:hypothetical protein